MKFKLSAKLLASHMIVAVGPLLLISGMLWMISAEGLKAVGEQGASAVEKAAYDELFVMRQIKEKQIAYFFKTMEGQLAMTRRNPWLLQLFKEFDRAFAEGGGSIQSEAWQTLARQNDARLQDLCVSLDWNNLFLINAQGVVVYSVNKASDLGQSLTRNPLSNSSLGRAVARLQAKPGLDMAFGDYAPYAPLGNEPSAFLVVRMAEAKEGDEQMGYLAIQPSTVALKNMIRLTSGKKRSLEAYAVGTDGYMRSDSVLDPENYSRSQSFKLNNKVDTIAAQNAFAGKSGTGVINDYRGNRVLSSWTPIDIFGTRWALICEVDEKEALAAKIEMAGARVAAGKKLEQWIAASLLLTTLVAGVIAWLTARSISRPIVRAAEVARIIAAGNLKCRLSMQRDDEIGQMADSLDCMVDAVSKNFRYKTGEAELSNRMRGELDIPTLARNVISFLSGFLGAQMASLYLSDGKGEKLSMIGSYAFSRRKGMKMEIRLGEGIAGQAALERTPVSVADLPNDYFRISSTLGEAVPRNVLAVPFLYEDRLVGVLEFASFKDFDDAEMHFLTEVAESIAIVFEAARRRQELQELLAKTREQSEELRQQGEELRATNEELEAQTAALREFQEELESQQAELETSNAELKEKSEALLARKNEIELRNQELVAAREELEERSKDLALASKYKSEFLANMSHELRTPLNSLLLLAGALADNKDGNLTGHQQESARVIEESGRDLLNLINEILDLSKIEAGRVDLEVEDVPLLELSATLQSMFGHMAKRKGLEFSVGIDPALPAAIVTDRRRLEQILKNFLGNSIKFTEHGKIEVSFFRPANQKKLRMEGVKSNQVVAISVADTGIGIPPEKHKIVFEAFQQADGSTVRKYGGTGLGLSISRELAGLLGGEIHLESEPGQGSVFTLFLPLTAGMDQVDAKEKKPEPLRQMMPPETRQSAAASAMISPVLSQTGEAIADDRTVLTLNDRSMLIVEDDLKFAKILMGQCRQRGFKALVAETGEEGLQLAERHQPTGIILDIKLPGIDGWTVLTSLKTNPGTRHIPVHMMSVEDGSREALRHGAVGFFTKPVDQEQIAEAFARLEAICSRKVKKLLVVEDDDAMRRAVAELVGGKDTMIAEAKSGKETHELLQSQQFDCMILDLGLPDCSGIELLRNLSADAGLAIPPVIVYTGRELSREEEKELNRHAESIIIKNARSKERLLDEVSLFLHRMSEHMPASSQEKNATGRYDQETVFQGRKILLVDDDMRNVFALSAVLEERGLKVVIAEHGRKALEILAGSEGEAAVDLVLMDIMMPEMDGYEAIRRIRQQKQFRNLPIIALTAKAMKDDREKCMEAGASDYLAKPVDLDRLLSMMRVWLYR